MKKDSKTPELPAKEPTAAAIEPEVVMPPEPVPRQPDLPAGGTPVDDGKARRYAIARPCAGGSSPSRRRR